MADKKNAKFFCENCGSEVGANARFCPKCGKFFASVRCPECGKLGSPSLFKKGCPRCHYAMTDEDIYGTSPAKTQDTADGLKHKLSRKSKKQIKEAFSRHEPSTQDAPSWLLITCMIVLAVIFAIVIYKCQ